jgi:hypothetical protein
MTIFRAGQDYLPLAPGNRWSYTDGRYPPLVDSVAGDTAIDGRTAVLYYHNYGAEYWVKSPTEVRQLLSLTLGLYDTLARHFGLVYSLPFVKGSAWTESFIDTVLLMGTDTLILFDSISGRVADFEDVNTPAGTYADCYRVEFWRKMHTNRDSTVQYTEWLAPGVGLVKRLSGFDSLMLVEYKPGR